MIIMTIAIWFAQKDTSNKFPDFNLLLICNWVVDQFIVYDIHSFQIG